MRKLPAVRYVKPEGIYLNDTITVEHVEDGMTVRTTGTVDRRWTDRNITEYQTAEGGVLFAVFGDRTTSPATIKHITLLSRHFNSEAEYLEGLELL